jgi:5'-deoxynucleotidase YfbR-like HD superfamily hydrolase
VVVRENVAEHSFWVVLYSMMIHRGLGGPAEALPLVLAYAAVHDLPECLTGDVVRTFKYSSPEMKSAVDVAEEALVRRFPPGLLEVYSEALDGTDDERHGWYVKDVVKAADFLSLYQYMWRERSKGNREIDQFFARMKNDMRGMSEASLRKSEKEHGWRAVALAQISGLYGCMSEDRFAQEFTTT